MKTSYQDFFSYYLALPSTDNDIKFMKQEIKRGQYTTWADLEIGLGQHSSKCESKDIFLSCLFDLKKSLAKYLQLESQKIADYRSIIEYKHYTICRKDKFSLALNTTKTIGAPARSAIWVKSPMTLLSVTTTGNLSKKESDLAIKRLINSEMAKRSCIVVLIGSTTSTRKWVKYEIENAYELGKGIVGIYIHGFKDNQGKQTTKGANPFYNILTDDGHRLSNYVTAYDTNYVTSKYVYDDIEEHISDLIEDATANAGKY